MLDQELNELYNFLISKRDKENIDDNSYSVYGFKEDMLLLQELD
jgi:hypothetical protein